MLYSSEVQMRVIRKTSDRENRPFNGLFEAYAHILEKMTEQRSFDEDATTYVPMTSIENELKEFALSGSTDIALLVGSIGIGKTRVVKYLSDVIWGSMNCLVVHNDLRIAAESIRLPHDFYERDDNDQWLHAAKIAHRRVNEMLQERFGADVTGWNRANPDEFVDFMQQFYPGKMPTSALVGASSPREVLHEIESQYPEEFPRFCFYYFLRKKNIQHVKFIIDNVDDKDATLIKAFGDILAHLTLGVKDFSRREREQDEAAPDRHLTAVMSCRPYTADLFNNEWFGTSKIEISQPCSLAQLLRKLYDNLMSTDPELGGKGKPATLNVNQMRWQASDRDRLFGKLLESFEKSGRSEEIVRLCNNNMAEAKKAFLQVVRNKHFVREQEYFAAVRETNTSKQQEIVGSVFTSTTVVCALAYGNQGIWDPVYPIASSPVVNLLEGKQSRFGHTLIKPRVLSMFLDKEHAFDSRPEISIARVSELASRFFDFDDQQISQLIDEMFADGLLANPRVVETPSKLGPKCTLVATPRAHYLWSLLRESSVLAECYRDDIWLDEELVWKGKRVQWNNHPTRTLTVENRLDALFWIVVECWNVEERELDSVSNKGNLAAFVDSFGPDLITELLLDGIDNSLRGFYRKYLQRDSFAIDSAEAKFAEIRQDISDSKSRWGL